MLVEAVAAEPTSISYYLTAAVVAVPAVSVVEAVAAEPTNISYYLTTTAAVVVVEAVAAELTYYLIT